MNQEQDRREYARLPQNFRVEVSELKFPLERQPKVSTKSADISAGGLKVDCSRKFGVGEKVQVTVHIASLNKYHPGFMKVFESDVGQKLKAIAEVAWVDERVPLSSYTLGLRFVDVDADDFQALNRLIRSRLDKASE